LTALASLLPQLLARRGLELLDDLVRDHVHHRVLLRRDANRGQAAHDRDSNKHLPHNTLSSVLVAVIDRAVAVILEAVHAALRILLHVHPLDRIPVVVRVLFALAVARAVVRGIFLVVHATLAGTRLLMPGVARRGKLLALRIQQRAVSAGLSERAEPAREDGSGA